MPSALIIHGVPIECINQAAVAYFVPAKIILSVLETEGGKPGLAKPNKNGTVDYGPMQINSIWLPKIEPYGYTRAQIQYDPCVNVMVGTWILSSKIASTIEDKKNADYWRGVAGYHSFSPKLNARYQHKVLGNYRQLSRALSGES